MNRIISPSLLAADFSNLKAVCEMINKSDAEWLHIDVMDGIFVPNISFGFPVMEAVRKHCKKKLDVHLMIEHPEKYITRFKEAGAEIITFHLETVDNPAIIIEQIKKTGAMAGMTINPNVPVGSFEPYINDVDLVLIMSVYAGYGGQKFIDETYQRLDQLHEIIERKNATCLVEVDGGVNLLNAPLLFEKGVNALVAGSAIFNMPDPVHTISLMLNS